MKKIFTVCLMIYILIFCMSVTGFGADIPLSERAYHTLIGCEIISREEAENSQEAITRKEAARIMIRLQGQENTPVDTEGRSPFLDVAADDPYLSDIVLGNELGIICGDGNDYFRPNDFLSLDEGMKLLISCLGYDVAAQQAGGFPNGYRSIAVQISLFSGVQTDELFSKADFYTMVYNTMQANAVIPDYGNSGIIRKDDKSFGERLMERKNILTGEELVIGNTRYSIQENNTIRSEYVQIGKEQFLLGDVSLPEILGRNVTYYAVLNQDDEYELTHVFKQKEEKELNLTEKQGAVWSTARLEYYDAVTEQKKSVKLAQDCRYIYNGRPVERLEEGNVNGDMTLVDHDGNGQYDLVIVKAIQTRRISYINTNKKSLHFKQEAWQTQVQLPQSLKTLEEEDEDRVIQIENSSGEQLRLEDLCVDDVITIMVSLDGKHVYICREENYVEGTVTSLSKDSIGLDTNQYPLNKKQEDTKSFGLEIGNEGLFYLNADGEIIYFVRKAGITKKYGYIAYASVDSNTYETILKLVSPGKIRYFEEAYDDGSTDKYLKATNESIGVHHLKSKLTINGSRMEAEKAIEKGILKEGMVIQYEQNNEGEIHKISFPESYYNADSRSCLRKFNTFTDSKAEKEADKTVCAFSAINKGGFKVSSEETAVFCVPPLPGEEQTITGDPNYSIQSDEDYFDQIKMNNGTSYYTRAYDFEEETGNVKVFMIVSGLNANRSDNVLQNEPWAILSSKWIEANEDEEYVYFLNGYSEGKGFQIKSMTGDANGLSRQLEDMLPGDVFKYTENTQGQIFEISPREDIFSIAADAPLSGDGFYSRESGNLLGRVSKIERKIIDESTTRYAHVLNIDYGDGMETIRASYTDTGIYIYNTWDKTVEVGTEQDIYSYEETGIDGDGSKIFAKVDAAGNAQIIVIIME